MAADVHLPEHGCDSDSKSRRTGTDRLRRVERRLQQAVPTFAFVYRSGDSPAEAETWRARVVGLAEDDSGIDLARRPPGMTSDEAFLFVELTDFERLPFGWVLEHLARWDASDALLDEGALKNQTSPLYVVER